MSQPLRPVSVSTPAPTPTKVDSDQLFAGQREVIIVHQGEAYRLRITRQDKLILTK
jgi:hemin uptake protein HemP